MNDRPHDATLQLADDRRFVMSVVRRIVSDPSAAEDVTQDAMLRAFRHRDSFRGDSAYRTWLYRVATTSALSHLRRERARGRWVVTIPDDREGDQDVRDGAVETSPATPADQLGEAQATAQIIRHVDALGDKYRSVFLLRFQDGYNEHETASALGLTVATVKVRTHRARHQLRSLLAEAA